MAEQTPPPLPGGFTPPPPLPRRAGLGMRALAFLMDGLLVFFFTLFLLIKILLPQNHAEGMRDMVQTVDSYAAAVQEAQRNGEPTPPAPEPAEDSPMVQMLAYSWQIMIITFWVYFGLVEALCKGTSLGKRTFGLRAIKIQTGQPASPFEYALRGGIKTLTLLFPLPLPMLLWVNYLIPFFNGNRRAGHDFLCRTVVIAE
ncbi:MAG: RDD family protein [Verrucomicrobiota bacterium JB024]|jgi:uncharacterized RDD family membrane protein YckC|nr:RDD family protein [Verrucomicrobiota bacterium JB024]